MRASEVLFQGEQQPVSIPSCDHYAGSEKLMRRSIALQQTLGPVFDITLDCEDGAAAGSEQAHAELVVQLLNADDNRYQRIGARVHHLQHPSFQDDVAIICGEASRRLAYLVLPKANGIDDVLRAAEVVERQSARGGRSGLPLHVLIETHGALADVHRIAALPQVECLSFGIMDFVSGHYGAVPASAMRTPGQFSHPLVVRAKLEIAAACHAHGKTPSHNVTTDIRDPKAAASDAARAAAEFGYTRMWSIHPSQIEAIVAAMAPAGAEVTEAVEILLAAQAVAWGPIQHEGRLHDRASYRYYWMLLQRARASGMALPESSESLFQHSGA